MKLLTGLKLLNALQSFSIECWCVLFYNSTYDKYVLFYRMMSKDWMLCYADYMRLIYNEANFQVRLHHSPDSHRCQHKGRVSCTCYLLTDGYA
jgi:hypothetical protein